MRASSSTAFLCWAAAVEAMILARRRRQGEERWRDPAPLAVRRARGAASRWRQQLDWLRGCCRGPALCPQQRLNGPSVFKLGQVSELAAWKDTSKQNETRHAAVCVSFGSLLVQRDQWDTY